MWSRRRRSRARDPERYRSASGFRPTARLCFRSCAARRHLGKIVHANLVAAVAIELVATPREALVVVIGADDFDETLEAREERRPLVAQIHEDPIVKRRAVAVL